MKLIGIEVGLGPGHIVLDGDPAPPKGAQPPNFRPMSVVAKRSPISATGEHLFSFLLNQLPMTENGITASLTKYNDRRWGRSGGISEMIPVPHPK